jgi:phosphotransferase system enzyme I (PtsP)
VRIGLDRPALLRYQLRALINAAAGRALRVMFPLVTTVAEFDAARALVDRELKWSEAHGRKPPSRTEVGVMVEAPALAWCIPDLKGKADFISIGTNDLMQYFFAADRGNPRVSDRYDILSAPALRLLKRIREDADAADLHVSICGEAAGRPLEALAFVALGFRRLSMPASGIGPVKGLVLALDAGAAAVGVERMLRGEGASIRSELTEFASEMNLPL